MAEVQKGIYTYTDAWDNIDDTSLPAELVLSDRISSEAVLIRLLCGTLKVKYTSDSEEEEHPQCVNYSILEGKENESFKKSIFKEFFSFEHYRVTERKLVDKYIRSNRKNHFVHEEVLTELTGAFVWMKNSPVEAFVHIYRALEFMSYSFPLLYASKSMDYRGSYENLKKFMNGDSDGELKFFRMFLTELFEDQLIYQYEYDIYFSGDKYEWIQAELQRVINEKYYTFEDNVMAIRFANVIDLLITLRNRYFHMLIGKGTYNFYDTRYDKREIFTAVNPVFLNWLSMIYKEIVVYSIGIL